MLFEDYLTKRNEAIHNKAADLLTFMGMPADKVTAYEESLIIQTAENIFADKAEKPCYPYYADNEKPCFMCDDCERKQVSKCRFVLDNAYVFTFGTDKQFPFSSREYVLVFAESESDAVIKYRTKYPDFTKGTVNCAFWYKADIYFSKEVFEETTCGDILY